MKYYSCPNGHKHMWKHHFLLGVVKHWPARQTVESPCVEILQTELDMVLNNLLQLTLHEPEGLDWLILRGP